MLSYFDSFCKGRKAERQPHLGTLQTSPRVWQLRSPETNFRTEKEPLVGKPRLTNKCSPSATTALRKKAGDMGLLQLLIYVNFSGHFCQHYLASKAGKKRWQFHCNSNNC